MINFVCNFKRADTAQNKGEEHGTSAGAQLVHMEVNDATSI